MKKLRDILQELLEYRKDLKTSEFTIENLRSNISLFLKYIEENLEITTVDQLKRKDLKIYQKYLSECTSSRGYPLKATSINSRIKGIRAFLEYLSKNDYIPKRLTEHISYVKVNSFLPSSVLTHKEIRKLVHQIDTTSTLGIRNRTIIELLYSTGIRIGELCSLRLTYIDFDLGIMKVFGKGSKERMVPVGKTALKWLQNYIRGVRPFQINIEKSDAVFLSSIGKPISQRSIREAIHTYATKAKIQINVTPHTFRRSCTTEMLKSNANIYHVKELLGHETLDTLQHYAKLTITDLKKTHAKCHPREKEEL